MQLPDGPHTAMIYRSQSGGMLHGMGLLPVFLLPRAGLVWFLRPIDLLGSGSTINHALLTANSGAQPPERYRKVAGASAQLDGSCFRTNRRQIFEGERV
jgi:hypothetical protein